MLFAISKIIIKPFQLVLLLGLMLLNSCHSSNNKDDFKITNFSVKGLDSLHKALDGEIKEQPNAIWPLFHRAQLFVALKDTNNALADLETALQKDTTKEQIYLYYAKLNEDHAIITKAVNAYKRVLQLNVKNTQALLGLGRIYYHIQNRDESFKYLNKAIEIDQYAAEAYYYRGLNFKELGMTENALKSLQTAVSVNNRYYEAYMQLGLINSLTKKPIAAAYYENAIRINPADPRAFFSRGYYFQTVDSTALAIKDYLEAIKREPGDKHAQYNLAFNYYTQKNYPKALEHFSLAYQLDSTFEYAKSGIDSCNFMMHKPINKRK